VGLGRRSAAALVVVGSFLYPLLIEPAFNRFEPMPASPLRTELLALADRSGTPVQDVLVADASRRTRRSTPTSPASARPGGSSSTTRSSTSCSDAEIESIVATSWARGHRRRPHRHLIGALGAGPGVALLGWLLGSPAAAPGRRRRAGDPRWSAAAVPARGRHLVSTPVQNLVSRHIEARADLHALDLTATRRPSSRCSAARRDQPRPTPTRRGLAVVLRLAPDEAAADRLRRGLGTAGRRRDRTLVVTNDFPPRQGGIQTFVAALLATPAAGVARRARLRPPGSAGYDAALPYPVVRAPTGMLLPTRATRAGRGRLAREHGCDSAFFGRRARWGCSRRRCARPAWRTGRRHARARDRLGGPARARQLMQRIAGGLDVLTYISEYTRRRLAPALAGRTGWRSCHPGVDVDRFTPGADGGAVRRRYGLGDAPVVVCVSRLVARKGQDVLVAGWPQVLRPAPRRPAAPGRRRPAEASLRGRSPAGSADSVVLTGAVPPRSCPRTTRPATSSRCPAAPARRAGRRGPGHGVPRGRRLRAAGGRRHLRRRAGGRAGGRHRARRRPAVARRGRRRVRRPARRPGRARAMGAAGRAWVEQRWSWTTIARPSPSCSER
jgi:phosphatidylinositol alpha-1,6-mannosyltransferase